MINVCVGKFSDELRRAGLVAVLSHEGFGVTESNSKSESDVYVAESKSFTRPVSRASVGIVEQGAHVSEVRMLLRWGVQGVISQEMSTCTQLEVIRAASFGLVSLPCSVLQGLLSRIEEPPRPLSADETVLLSAAAATSVSRAGELLGLSRRQVQRRFKALCGELDLDSYHEAVLAATRWGLTSQSD